MGNKQTIFTDEQLDAYQVRLSSCLQRAHRLKDEPVITGGVTEKIVTGVHSVDDVFISAAGEYKYT